MSIPLYSSPLSWRIKNIQIYTEKILDIHYPLWYIDSNKIYTNFYIREVKIWLKEK